MSTPIHPKLKTSFKKAHAISPLYTGGPVAISQDGTKIVTCLSEQALLSDVTSGQEICRFKGDTENITALCLTDSGAHLLLFTSSLALRIYEVPSSSSPLPKAVPPIRVISRAHDAPVHVCRADPTSSYLASGAADGVVKVWDIARGYVTHVFKGHGGIVSALAFSLPRDPGTLVQQRAGGVMRLITASADTRVRVFDLVAARKGERSGALAKPEAVLEGHVSVPRGLDVSEDGRWLVSGGRDSVVLVWDMTGQSGAGTAKGKGKGKEKEAQPVLFKTIPVLERVEALGLLHPGEEIAGSSSGKNTIRFFTGGEKGMIKIWDGQQGSLLHIFGSEETSISDDQEEQRQIVSAFYVPSVSTILSVHADQNLLFHSIPSRSLARQMIGFNDEIVDATFLSADSTTGSSSETHLALATNSSLIRVYSTSNHDARLLDGHTDIVLSLDHSSDGRLLASGSKDRSARIWAPLASSSDGKSESWGWTCVALCEGHAESVGAIAMARQPDDESNTGPRFMFTGSQDRTIKMWDLSGVATTSADASTPIKCKSLATLKAHDKDINALDVAPNDRFLASGSQDKTAKIYEVEYVRSGTGVRGQLRHIGTCKGHKRGVWTVRFGRAERVLATGSGDRTVRLWNLNDFSCVKTFEGHTNSVLRVDFVNMGMQMVSAASDGLVKLWNVREEECVATMDGHEDKVWALAVSKDERTIVSGAADSVVNFWKDSTEEDQQEKEAKRADLVLKEQDFMNYLSLQDYRKAITLALAMEQPGRLYKLFRDLQANAANDIVAPAAPSITGNSVVDEVIRTLEGTELAKLLRYVREWNTRAKTATVAQSVLHAVVRLRAAEDVVRAFGGNGGVGAFEDEDNDGTAAARTIEGTALKELVDALIPYTERHLARMEKLVQESYVVDHLLAEMDDGMFVDEEDDEEDAVDAMDVDDTGAVKISAARELAVSA